MTLQLRTRHYIAGRLVSDERMPLPGEPPEVLPEPMTIAAGLSQYVIEVVGARTPRSSELMSIEEAAEAIGVTPQTMRRLCREGAVHARKIGRQWRVARASVKL